MLRDDVTILAAIEAHSESAIDLHNDELTG